MLRWVFSLLMLVYGVVIVAALLALCVSLSADSLAYEEPKFVKLGEEREGEQAQAQIEAPSA